MTTLCYVAGMSPLLTGMLEPSGPVAQGELRIRDLIRAAVSDVGAVFQVTKVVPAALAFC